MRFQTSCLLALLCFIVAGCASKGDLDYLRSDMEELKTRLFRSEEELRTLRSETREGVEKNVQGLQNELGALRKGTADLQAAIEAIRVDMQVAAGKVDDMTIAVKKPADDIALVKEDTNRRITALEGRMGQLQQFVDEQKKAAREKTETPDELYQKGLDTFKKGDVSKARELFTAFVEHYPSHPMAANAHYWLGETYYSEKKFDQAILAFQEIIKNFPKAEKVPAAELKQGMAFRELGDAKNARYLFRKIIEDYPRSEEAPLAREKLKETR